MLRSVLSGMKSRFARRRTGGEGVLDPACGAVNVEWLCVPFCVREAPCVSYRDMLQWVRFVPDPSGVSVSSRVHGCSICRGPYLSPYMPEFSYAMVIRDGRMRWSYVMVVRDDCG